MSEKLFFGLFKIAFRTEVNLKLCVEDLQWLRQSPRGAGTVAGTLPSRTAHHGARCRIALSFLQQPRHGSWLWAAKRRKHLYHSTSLAACPNPRRDGVRGDFCPCSLPRTTGLWPNSRRRMLPFHPSLLPSPSSSRRARRQQAERRRMDRSRHIQVRTQKGGKSRWSMQACGGVKGK